MRVRLIFSAIAVIVNSCHGPTELGDMYVRDTSYAGYGEVVADDAFVRGWVPQWLPKTATDIQERHSLDSNEVWGRFTVPHEELAAIERKCAIVPESEINWPRSPNRFSGVARLSWWRAELESKTGTQTNVMRHTEGPEFYLVLVRGSGSVVYWEGTR